MGQKTVAHPCAVFPSVGPVVQTVHVAGAFAFDNVEELGPVGVRIVIVTAFFVPFDAGIGQVEAQILDLRNGLVDKLLTQVIIRPYLDLPGHRLFRMHAFAVRRAEHHDRGEPQAIHGVLCHGFLSRRAKGHLHDRVIALTCVEAFFLTDADHRAAIGTIGCPLQGHLVHDGRAIHQPTHGADIGPVQVG